ncbi:hypothetical protein KFE25_013141 [Diacronema lutheri]|uniref:Uncharacterized protein n=1 Tax=Diacronema lutheri TaxID=2081491 RepID=A0A8J6C6X5_DIALT|nr:hypothetical protein KFE25_013141 [Diacronema lutheri]
MQVPVKYVGATVEPGSTRVRFTVSVPPRKAFQNVDVRANVMAINGARLQGMFEAAGLGEAITAVGEPTVVVPSPPPPPSPPPKRDGGGDDVEQPTVPPSIPGLAQATVIALSTVVPVGSLIICAIAARSLYIRRMKAKLVTLQGIDQAPPFPPTNNRVL